MDEQELFFEAVYADPTMSDADKVRWLHHSAKEYWQRLEWAEKRYAMRDAEGSAWAEQATQNAAALAASEAARRQAEEEWAVRGACLRALRARLPQPTLDDLCDWQRDQIDAVLGRPEPPADDAITQLDAEDVARLRRAVRVSQLVYEAIELDPDEPDFDRVKGIPDELFGEWVDALDGAYAVALAAAPVAEGRGAGEGGEKPRRMPQEKRDG